MVPVYSVELGVIQTLDFFFNGLSGGRKYCTESFMNSYLLFFFLSLIVP